jgi:TonB family protein
LCFFWGIPSSSSGSKAYFREDHFSGGRPGTAVIAFTVSEDGGLATLGVAQSSGVAEIDQAGLALLQRASPFPAPPVGAQRSFSFQFTSN